MQSCWKPADWVKKRTLRVLPSAARVQPSGSSDAAANAAAMAATVRIACRRVMPSEHVHM